MPCHLGNAVLDEAGFRRRASHVEADQVPDADQHAEVRCRDHARRRSRLHQVHRLAPRHLRGDDPARGGHQVEAGLHPDPRKAVFQKVKVAADDWHLHRVDDRRARTEVLAHLRTQFRGKRHEYGRQLFRNDCAHPPLVRRVDVGVQQANGDGLHVLLANGPHHLTYRVLVERPHHPAGVVDSLGNAVAKVARDQRLRFLAENVVEARPDLSRNLQHVAKTLGGDQRGMSAFAFDDRVGGHCRPVNQAGDRPRRRPRLL